MPVLVKKFEASVAGHFGAKQTEAIKKMFADRAALDAMPVSDFMAQMVSAVLRTRLARRKNMPVRTLDYDASRLPRAPCISG